MVRLFETRLARDTRIYLEPTVQSISDALVDLPQDLIQAGHRLVAVLRQSPEDFTPYWESLSQLASRCRVIRTRLAGGPVPTFAHLSTLARLFHDVSWNLQYGQDARSTYMTLFMASVDDTTKSWFSEVGTFSPVFPPSPSFILLNGQFHRVTNPDLGPF